MLVRADQLARRTSRYLATQIERHERIDVRTSAVLNGVAGGRHLESVRVRGPGGEEAVGADELFVIIGGSPLTFGLESTLVLDESGYMVTGPEVLARAGGRWPLERDPMLLESSQPGLFAAGDIRHGSTKRVAAAVGEGAMAVALIHNYLAQLPSAQPQRSSPKKRTIA
jgi:thioredoxin reductase (NADPH)